MKHARKGYHAVYAVHPVDAAHCFASMPPGKVAAVSRRLLIWTDGQTDFKRISIGDTDRTTVTVDVVPSVVKTPLFFIKR